MANFGWAYINCSDTGSATGAANGPSGSVQYMTGAGDTDSSGSANFTYQSAYNLLQLTGTLSVAGTITASHMYIEDVTVIDSTGSTYFGNTDDDVHIRTGSMTVTKTTWGTDTYLFSASAHDESVRVRGFGGYYYQVTGSTYTVKSADYIIGVAEPNTVTITLPGPSGSNTGRFLIIKDEYSDPPLSPGRGTGSILVTGSLDSSYIDHEASYTMTGTLPAINLYSNGSNWFIF